jgi:hypothetical protein
MEQFLNKAQIINSVSVRSSIAKWYAQDYTTVHFKYGRQASLAIYWQSPGRNIYRRALNKSKQKHL